MKTVNLNSGRKFAIAILLCFILQNNIFAQHFCQGSADDAPIQNSQSAAPICLSTFTGNMLKYKKQETYIPATNDPLITLKLVVHVFTPTTQVAYAWNNSNSPWNGVAGLNDLFNRIQNANERHSLARSANYTGTSTHPGIITDSKLRYEVVAYYFYPSNQYFYGTANGLPAQTNPSLPNYNPKIYTSNNAMAYIKNNFPDRAKEGLPIIMMQDGPVQRTISLLPNNGLIPFVTVGHSPGIDQTTLNNNNAAAEHQLRHEIGHATGLNHTYYGGDGNPNYYGYTCITNTCPLSPGGYPSKSPETNLLHASNNNSSLDCNNPDYLSDVFLSNNPACPAQCPPTNTAITNLPPMSGCGSCYERDQGFMGSNNIMSDNSVNVNSSLPYSYGWISELQMGRRIRSMHLAKTSGTWYGSPDWSNIRYFAKEMVSGHANPWLITSNETWDFDIQMYKDIRILSGNTLKITCKVAMPTDGKIIVEPGAKLIIDQGLVTGWCKKTPNGSNYGLPLWSGIEVIGNPNQNQLINNATGLCPNQGIVEIINTGTVSYALRGVSTSSYNNTGAWINNTSGGIVIAKDANFINNVYDVILYKYQNGNARSKFTNCNFITNAEIGKDVNLVQIAPKEHVKLYDNFGANFYGCNFEYMAGTTYPASSKGIGIYATDSHFNVDQYCFSANCSSSIRTHFKYLRMGVYIDNFNSLFTGIVKNCEFIDNNQATMIENSYNTVFSDNNIVMTSNYTGVYTYKSKYYNIKNNTIASQFWQSGGVVAYDSQNGLHQIYRNTFSGLNCGILAMDNNGGLNQGTSGLKMTCNVFNNGATNQNDIGLTTYIAPMPIVMKEQSLFNPGNSALDLVRNLYGATYMSPLSPNKWNVDPSSTQNIFHASTIAGADNPNVPNVQASQQVQVIPAPFVFTHALHCLANPSSSGGSSTSNAQALANMNNYITHLREEGEAGRHEIQATVAAKLNLFLTDTLLESKDSVIAIYQNNQGAMEDADVLEVFALMRKGDYVNAGNKASELSPLRKDWRDIILKIIEIKQDPQDVYSLLTNTSNVQFLQAYANTEGKDGQACAQAMLRFVFDTEHDYPLVFPQINGHKQALNVASIENIDNSNFQIFPNPTKSSFTLQNKGNELVNVKLEVKDLLGRIIYTNFIGKETSYTVSLSGFGNGVYIVTLFESNNKAIYRKPVMKQD